MNTHLEPDLPAVLADPSRIEQVIMNLTLNAIQASQASGEVRVTTRVELLDAERGASLQLPEGRYARLEVRDEGAGMDAETTHRVFEPFFTTKTTGRGMGLSATLGIIQSHHGQIKVASEPEQGTTMSVWLPLADAETPTDPPTDDRPAPQDPPRGTETLLIIDDDESVARATEQMLALLGYVAVAHTDTDEALAFVGTNAEDLDLILLDLNMPKRSGAEMLSHLERTCP